MATMLTRAEIDAIVRGMHPDPFAVLGPHEAAAGLAIRVFRPDARAIELSSPGDPTQTPFERIHPEGLFEAVVPSATREAFDYRLRVPWHDGLVRRDRRSVSLRPGAHRLRSAPARRRHALPGVRQAGRAPHHARHPRPACTSRCGRRTRGASAWSATSTRGTAACTRCARCGPGGYWEIFMPDLGSRRSVQVRDHRRRRRAGAQGRSVRPLLRAAAATPRRSSGTAPATQWQDERLDAARAAAASSGGAGRCRSTKCISAAGSARRTAGCYAIARWPTGSCPT